MNTKKENIAAQFADLLSEIERRDSFHIDAAKLELSEQIYQAMENKGVTEAELSRRLGTSRAYINKILQGNVNFTIETLVKISRALDHKFEFRFADNAAPADVLDAQIVYERITAPIPTFAPRHGYSPRNNVFDFGTVKLDKNKDFSIVDTEVAVYQKSEKNYAPVENAA